MPDSITLTFKIEKETKNTIRYAVVEEFGAITTLYINKRDLKEKWGGCVVNSMLMVTPCKNRKPWTRKIRMNCVKRLFLK